jgi:hypothetical protein
VVFLARFDDEDLGAPRDERANMAGRSSHSSLRVSGGRVGSRLDGRRR